MTDLPETDLRETDGAGGEAGREPAPIPRAGRRRRLIQQGRVVLGPDYSVACEIADVSRDGARLRIPARVALPDAFLLVIADHDLRTVTVRLRWRRGDFAGVTFEGAGFYVA